MGDSPTPVLFSAAAGAVVTLLLGIPGVFRARWRLDTRKDAPVSPSLIGTAGSLDRAPGENAGQ